MKTNKTKKLDHFFLYQKDMHIISLIKKGNLKQKLNKSGVKIVYPRIKLQLKENIHGIDKDKLKNCIVSQVKTKRSSSLPLLLNPNTNKINTLYESIVKETKPDCFDRHKQRSVEYRNNKNHLYNSESVLNQNQRYSNYNKNINDKPELRLKIQLQESQLRNEMLRSELRLDQFFDKRIRNKLEEKESSNRKKSNMINSMQGSITERRKINVIGTKDIDNKIQLPKISIDKPIELDCSKSPLHYMRNSLRKEDNSLMESNIDLNSLNKKEAKEETNYRHYRIKKRNSNNNNSFNVMQGNSTKSKKNSIERSVQTIRSLLINKVSISI